MKFIRNFSRYLTAFLACAVFGIGSVSAQTAKKSADPLQGVAGYDAKQSGGTQIGFSNISAAGYTVQLSDVFGVSFSEISGMTALKTEVDKPTNRSVGLYALPDGTKLYAMPLGKEWGNGPEEVAQVQVERAKAVGNVQGGVATLSFKREAGERCRPVTWVAQLPNGQRLWGSHPDGSGWVTKNVNGSPMTVWCFNNNQVVQAPQDVRAALAQKK